MTATTRIRDMSDKDIQTASAMKEYISHGFHTSNFEPSPDAILPDQFQPRAESSQGTELLYSRTPRYQQSPRSKTSSSFSGSEPVEHDEEEDQSRSSSCGLSSSSGYTGSCSSKLDPFLDKIPHDPTAPMVAFFQRASSETSSSAVSDVSSLECSTCKMFRATCPSKESLDFWSEVESYDGETCNMKDRPCHSKFWIRFYEKLKEKFPGEESLKSKQTRYLLKTLLGVGEQDEGIVELSKFLKIVRFFGPAKNDSDSGGCCLLKHLNEIVKRSVRKNGNKERVSWFAGDLPRTEVERLLQNKRNGTYLVRMSQSGAVNGDFVVSVMDGSECVHFEIEGNPQQSAESSILDCHLQFLGRSYRTLPDAIEALQTTPLHDEDTERDIWCSTICPGLPFSNVMTPYKRTK